MRNIKSAEDIPVIKLNDDTVAKHLLLNPGIVHIKHANGAEQYFKTGLRRLSGDILLYELENIFRKHLQLDDSYTRLFPQVVPGKLPMNKITNNKTLAKSLTPQNESFLILEGHSDETYDITYLPENFTKPINKFLLGAVQDKLENWDLPKKLSSNNIAEVHQLYSQLLWAMIPALLLQFRDIKIDNVKDLVCFIDVEDMLLNSKNKAKYNLPFLKDVFENKIPKFIWESFSQKLLSLDSLKLMQEFDSINVCLVDQYECNFSKFNTLQDSGNCIVQQESLNDNEFINEKYSDISNPAESECGNENIIACDQNKTYFSKTQMELFNSNLINLSICIYALSQKDHASIAELIQAMDPVFKNDYECYTEIKHLLNEKNEALAIQLYGKDAVSSVKYILRNEKENSFLELIGHLPSPQKTTHKHARESNDDSEKTNKSPQQSPKKLAVESNDSPNRSALADALNNGMTLMGNTNKIAVKKKLFDDEQEQKNNQDLQF